MSHLDLPSSNQHPMNANEVQALYFSFLIICFTQTCQNSKERVCCYFCYTLTFFSLPFIHLFFPGRDDGPADCIVFFGFMDIFRISTMVVMENTGQQKLHNMIAYCQNVDRWVKIYRIFRIPMTWLLVLVSKFRFFSLWNIVLCFLFFSLLLYMVYSDRKIRLFNSFVSSRSAKWTNLYSSNFKMLNSKFPVHIHRHIF